MSDDNSSALDSDRNVDEQPSSTTAPGGQLRAEIDSDVKQPPKRGNSESGSNLDLAEQTVPISSSTLKQLIDYLFSSTSGIKQRQFKALQLTRKLLGSGAHHPTIGVVIDAGVVPKCVDFLKRDDTPLLQFEAAWLLINITSGSSEQTNVVVDAGAVAPLITLLTCPYDYNIEQAVWALGNIAGDGPELRDLVLSMGILRPLIYLAKSINYPSILKQVSWSLSNLCRSKVKPASQPFCRKILPTLTNLLNMTDLEVVSNAAWAISNLCDGPKERLEDIIRARITPVLVKHLECDNDNVLIPCLRVIGEIIFGSAEQTTYVITCGLLNNMGRLLTSQNNTVLRIASWVVSNVAVENASHIPEIFQLGLPPKLLDIARTSDKSAQQEAVWAITNLVIKGTEENIRQLCQYGVVSVLCSMLDNENLQTVSATLDGLLNMLRRVGETEQVALAIQEYNGLDLLVALHPRRDSYVWSKACAIVEIYFPHKIDILNVKTNDNSNPMEAQ